MNCFVFTLVNGKGKKNVKPTTLKKERKERDYLYEPIEAIGSLS